MRTQPRPRRRGKGPSPSISRHTDMRKAMAREDSITAGMSGARTVAKAIWPATRVVAPTITATMIAPITPEPLGRRQARYMAASKGST
jgi:hypothetical protein